MLIRMYNLNNTTSLTLPLLPFGRTDKPLLERGNLFMGTESFYPLLGFEGTYEISKSGIIKSTLNRRAKTGRKPTGKPLKQVLGRSGYYQVYLRRDTKRSNQISLLLHRLIAINFIPNPENKPQVNHINSIRTDNRIENLEWCTNSENQKHAYKYGGQIHRYGSDHNQAKLTLIQVNEIRNKYIKRIYTAPMLAKEYGVSNGCIVAIINKTSWNKIAE